VLAHAKVIVATPHRHGRFASVRFIPYRMGELTARALNVDKRAIPTFRMEVFNRVVQHLVVIQKPSFRLSPAPSSAQIGIILGLI
jgi:hypothetical protein